MEVQHLLTFSSNFVENFHCFREGNQVVNCLSNVGCDE